MIVENLVDFDPVSVFVRIRDWIRDDVKLYMKYEVFNPGGSIKFKPAVGIVRQLEDSGVLAPGKSIIDTTSGNMGVSLCVVARSRGYGFVCVTDEKITRHNRSLIDAYGAALVVLPGSSLSERYDYIAELVRSDERLVWTRQFTNGANPATHEMTTAQEILRSFRHFDYLFVGTGTGGTLAGCVKAFAQEGRDVRVVAVDAEGSAHFCQDAPKKRRLLPGIGATVRSPFLDDVDQREAVVVPEAEAIHACRHVATTTGWLFGASSGSILAGIRRREAHFRSGQVVIGIAADSGERYLDGLYDPEWCEEHFPGVLTAQTVPGVSHETEGAIG